MAWPNISCLNWTLVISFVLLFSLTYSRPQESTPSLLIKSAPENDSSKATETTTRNSELSSPAPVLPTSTRNVKTKSPPIGDSIKLVASQLLEEAKNKTAEVPIVNDTRIPPKLKNQMTQKQKTKTRYEDSETKLETFHQGVAVPITMEELEIENKSPNISDESSTSNAGISTWILLSNPTSKDETYSSTEPTKPEEVTKKTKPSNKNKTKRPQVNKAPSRPTIIATMNKSDLVAGGSAINDNVYNKIKDTVLTNVQKNKISAVQKTTTEATTTSTTNSEIIINKKDVTSKSPSTVVPVIKVAPKITKKKNKNKPKIETTEAAIVNESAALPMEPKEQEIELEISTPPTTTKKPKRSSSKRKKNKTKKRKTTKPKPEIDNTALELKSSNKTKSAKPTKKPESPITTQIYNYLSREVMPSVGVGVIGLAGLVGLASYFFYPFATPVRRTFEVDKKDDIYRHNAEEYANEGNGQAEEEMLGTVLAGMPVHSKNRINPYIAQTAHTNTYPLKKEQDLRYRHVATNYESPNYNMHYPQQKTGLAHGVIYSDHLKYNTQQQDLRHGYTTETNYAFEKSAYTPYPAAEPIYSAPQTDISSVSGYGNEESNSVVYGVKPAADTDFKPVYPFEGQVFSETTSNPAATYPPTSMYLGSNNESEQTEKSRFMEDETKVSDKSNEFVVGNVPKELVDSDTPAVVPEHGPRKFNRKRRSVASQKRSITGSIEQILKETQLDKNNVFLSNEIDETLGQPDKNPEVIHTSSSTLPPNVLNKQLEDSVSEDTSYTDLSTVKEQLIESVSTTPLKPKEHQETTLEPEMSNELETTTKTFKVYEVFNGSDDVTEKVVPVSEQVKETTESVIQRTTEFGKINTETTTEPKSEGFSNAPSESPENTVDPTSTQKPKPTYNPNVITYPPIKEEGSFFTFLKRLIEFKYRLGLSILQTTSDSLNRYLRNMENTVTHVAKASSI